MTAFLLVKSGFVRLFALRAEPFSPGALRVHALLCGLSSSFFKVGVQQDDPELLCHIPCRQSIGKAPVLDPPFEDMTPPVGRPNKQERVSYASTYDLARTNPPWNRQKWSFTEELDPGTERCGARRHGRRAG